MILMYADYQIMKPSDFSGILTKGGTILGTSRQPFKLMRVRREGKQIYYSLDDDHVKRIIEMGLDHVLE